MQNWPGTDRIIRQRRGVEPVFRAPPKPNLVMANARERRDHGLERGVGPGAAIRSNQRERIEVGLAPCKRSRHDTRIDAAAERHAARALRGSNPVQDFPELPDGALVTVRGEGSESQSVAGERLEAVRGDAKQLSAQHPANALESGG